MVVNTESGIFFPQNSEYSNTSNLVELIAAAHGKKIKLVKGFSLALKLLSHVTPLVNKAFGSLSYSRELSVYKESYDIWNLEESIKKTES